VSGRGVQYLTEWSTADCKVLVQPIAIAAGDVFLILISSFKP